MLKAELVDKYGNEFAINSIKEMTTALRRLEQFADSGVRIAEMYDIDTDYYFMMKLFGMSGRTQESIDYWGE